jgi:LacI family gluconate utilization system Gnt-I transcriptional repressor
LATKGYRKFAYIGGTTERDTRGNQRRSGFQAAVAELGLPEGRVVSFGVPPISMEQGAQALGSVLAQWPDTQVVICVSDLSAFGALMECHRRGLSVPKDMAIAGFGNYEIAATCHPRITSVDIQCYEIGKLAAQKLIQTIQNPARDGRTDLTLTNIRIIEREST